MTKDIKPSNIEVEEIRLKFYEIADNGDQSKAQKNRLRWSFFFI